MFVIHSKQLVMMCGTGSNAPRIIGTTDTDCRHIFLALNFKSAYVLLHLLLKLSSHPSIFSNSNITKVRMLFNINNIGEKDVGLNILGSGLQFHQFGTIPKPSNLASSQCTFLPSHHDNACIVSEQLLHNHLSDGLSDYYYYQFTKRGRHTQKARPVRGVRLQK